VGIRLLLHFIYDFLNRDVDAIGGLYSEVMSNSSWLDCQWHEALMTLSAGLQAGIHRSRGHQGISRGGAESKKESYGCRVGLVFLRRVAVTECENLVTVIGTGLLANHQVVTSHHVFRFLC